MYENQDFNGLSITGCRWHKATVNSHVVTKLTKDLNVPTLLAHTLVWRGLSTKDEAEHFINASLHSIPDPNTMLNMPLVQKVIMEALAKSEPIRIVGDYDCDGTTGLITLLQTFRLVNPAASKNITYHVPDRERDGYGLNPEIIHRAKADGVKILISVDIGITAHNEWTMAKENGITGICIDHHTVLGSHAPKDAIVLCPKQAGCPYPEKNLAACGISLQLASVLLEKHPRREAIIESLCKLVAIGTVADMVPLKSPANRAIVQTGLRGLNSGTSNNGLHALLEVSGLHQQRITTYDLGFKLGPRINAAGRMDGSTLQVVALLDSISKENARVLAHQIDELNRQRQIAQQWLVDQILAIVEQQNNDDFIFVFGGEHEQGWHQGVVGIAAAKIVERYFRPTLVCSIRNGIAHGSARSTKNLNIVHALEAVADGLLTKYGGHAMAAGFTLPATLLPQFRKRINDYAHTILNDDDVIPTKNYEIELTPEDITLELFHTLAKLEPYGIENPKPSFIVRGRLTEIRSLAGRHLRLRLVAKGPTLEAVWWQHGEFYENLHLGDNIALLGKLELNEWNGTKKLQINVEDIYQFS